MGLKFGSFQTICDQSPLPLCALVEGIHFNGPICYSRSIDINSTLLFQPSTLTIDIVALLMTLVMVYHIKTKYTAVGRKEMVMFFYLYLVTLILEFVVISGFIPTSSTLYPYFTAAYYGSIGAAIICLMLNGFVGFQFAEDGTFWSLWTIRLISLFTFGLGFLIALGTFLNVGLSKNYPTVLFIYLFLLLPLAILIYAILQIVLVVNTLDDLWPIGNIVLGTLLFFMGQFILLFLSTKICDFMGHYIDGYFFTTIATLLAVMMVYKYWDSITKEDLEFSVSGNHNVWEVKELLEDRPLLNHNLPLNESTTYNYPARHHQALTNNLHQPTSIDNSI